MRAFILVLLLVAVLHAEGKPKCKPGRKVKEKDGCNWCQCSDRGTPDRCTNYDCLPGAWLNFARDGCMPGEQMLSDEKCRNCVCNEDGESYLCTTLPCYDLRDKLVFAD